MASSFHGYTFLGCCCCCRVVPLCLTASRLGSRRYGYCLSDRLFARDLNVAAAVAATAASSVGTGGGAAAAAAAAFTLPYIDADWPS